MVCPLFYLGHHKVTYWTQFLPGFGKVFGILEEATAPLVTPFS